MPHIHLFMNNPTEGAKDGTQISAGDETLPLTFTLNSTIAESDAKKCAVRCDTGFSVSGGATVYAEGTTSDTWTFATDNNYSSASDAIIFATWQPQIVLNDVADTNVIFWAKATSSTQDSPQNDRSVDIVAEGLVVVAE